jgi:predicted nicotinamide N-methyase
MAALTGSDLIFLNELLKCGKRRVQLDEEVFVEVHQNPSFGDTSTIIWPSAVRLAALLRAQRSVIQSSGTGIKSVIELGCGCYPLVSIALASAGPLRVIATDLPRVIQSAAFINTMGSYPGLESTCLDWEKPVPSALGGFDLIVAADVLYSEKLYLPFVRTLAELCSRSPPTCYALICWQLRNREAEERFLAILRGHLLAYVLVPRTVKDSILPDGPSEEHYKYTRIIRVFPASAGAQVSTS